MSPRFKLWCRCLFGRCSTGAKNEVCRFCMFPYTQCRWFVCDGIRIEGTSIRLVVMLPTAHGLDGTFFCLCPFPFFLYTRLFVISPLLHFFEETTFCKLVLEDFYSLLDIIVVNLNLQSCSPPLLSSVPSGA